MDSQLPLRDIHLPDPSGWWPPAPGWWLLLLLIVVVTLLVWWIKGKHRQRAALRAAQRQLKEVQSSFIDDQNSQRLLGELSELVRRVMISHYHREDVSALVGEAWLARLDQALGCSQAEDKSNHEFVRGVGSVLATGPYQQYAEFDAPELIALVQRLIQKVLTPAWFGGRIGRQIDGWRTE